MGSIAKNDSAKINRKQTLYNAIPNFFWSILAFVPVTIYCYRYFDLQLLLIFLAISFIGLFIPNAWLDKLQLSRSTTLYKKLRVPLINEIAQNGALLTRTSVKNIPLTKIFA